MVPPGTKKNTVHQANQPIIPESIIIGKYHIGRRKTQIAYFFDFLYQAPTPKQNLHCFIIYVLTDTRSIYYSFFFVEMSMY